MGPLDAESIEPVFQPIFDLAADTIFWSTIVSCFTITGWLIVIPYIRN